MIVVNREFSARRVEVSAHCTNTSLLSQHRSVLVSGDAVLAREVLIPQAPLAVALQPITALAGYRKVIFVFPTTTPPALLAPVLVSRRGGALCAQRGQLSAVGSLSRVTRAEAVRRVGPGAPIKLTLRSRSALNTQFGQLLPLLVLLVVTSTQANGLYGLLATLKRTFRIELRVPSPSLRGQRKSFTLLLVVRPAQSSSNP
ncbi:hypothetical protein [Streptomyces sp. bgisy159]|uniref:hypothetical protein n=1 Tax=Streptomyces sp. bgisy159 TaxID=3413795 RepID=UPI003F4A7F87